MGNSNKERDDFIIALVIVGMIVSLIIAIELIPFN